MAQRRRSELRRAFEDLSEGLRALLGVAGTTPRFVDELLARPNENPQPREECRERGVFTARVARRSVSRRVRLPGSSRSSHLSLVK